MKETRPTGTLIVIGGGEDKKQEQAILQQVAQAARHDDGLLVIIAAASSLPEELAAEYTAVFTALGVKRVDTLACNSREQASEAAHIDTLRHATAVFLTGGDQLRLTSLLGGSLVLRCLRDLLARGGTIAGTSAGAAAMSSTMLVGGAGDKSHKLFSLDMAPGLGLLEDVVIDSHFAERGRISRLLGAVAQNPSNLGVGLDEDTAVMVQHETFRVLGTGAVYVIDGSAISYSSLAEDQPEGMMSIYDVKLHILTHGDEYDLAQRRPHLAPEHHEPAEARGQRGRKRGSGAHGRGGPVAEQQHHRVGLCGLPAAGHGGHLHRQLPGDSAAAALTGSAHPPGRPRPLFRGPPYNHFPQGVNTWLSASDAPR